VQVLLAEGAREVVVAATHPVLVGDAPQLLANCGASEIVVTNTLPITDAQRFPQLTELTIAPLIARAIREVFDDGSVTSLFDGNA
jgi:ribose-phosphate pyrophosphokinase